MTYRKSIKTAKDLADCLSKLGDTPLCQIITVRTEIGQTKPNELYFNQIDDFGWDYDNDELEITL